METNAVRFLARTRFEAESVMRMVASAWGKQQKRIIADYNATMDREGYIERWSDMGYRPYSADVSTLELSQDLSRKKVGHELLGLLRRDLRVRAQRYPVDERFVEDVVSLGLIGLALSLLERRRYVVIVAGLPVLGRKVQPGSDPYDVDPVRTEEDPVAVAVPLQDVPLKVDLALSMDGFDGPSSVPQPCQLPSPGNGSHL
jgi:hypothetical protein